MIDQTGVNAGMAGYAIIVSLLVLYDMIVIDFVFIDTVLLSIPVSFNLRKFQLNELSLII